MNIVLTGIGPMLENCKSIDVLSSFDPENTAKYGGAEWFDPKVDCGGRGFKYFNLATRYMIAAMRQIDMPVRPDDAGPEADGRGVVIGSNSCTRRELDEFNQVILGEGSDAINPMRAPSFCANIGTGNVGIKHQTKAFNITLVNPIVAGLEAVILAKNAILESRATTVFAGSMEDDSQFRLNNDCRVTTVGGAWALKLESAELVNLDEIVGSIGSTLNRLIPANKLDDEKLKKQLGSELESLIDGVVDVAVYVAMQNDARSLAILGMLKEQFLRLGIPESAIKVPSTENQLGTMLSIAHLSWCALYVPRAICLAISSLGHITAVTVTQGGGR